MNDGLRRALGRQVPADIRARAFVGQGSGDPQGGSMLVRQIGAPWYNKLPGSTDFNVNAFDLTLGAGVGTTVDSDNLRFRLPNDAVGYVDTFSIYVLSQTASTSVSFALRINQGPVPGYDNRQNFPGVANLFARDVGGVGVRIPAGGIVDIIVTNLNANGPWTVGGVITGWYHSYREEQEWWG